MTEQTNKAIQEAAEAKYPRYPQGHASPQDINFAKKQKAFIAGATLYAEQLEEARKECERVRGLVGEAFKEGMKSDMSTMTTDWQQFKTDNNL